MEIRKIDLGILGVNCYLISGESGAVVIDPGYESPEAIEFLKENKDKERLIILTHCHFDHVGFATALSKETDTKIAIGEFETEGLYNDEINLSANFAKKMTPVKEDITLKDGEVLKVGDLEFKVIHTPGHTVGGIALLSDKTLFSGDTLFFESIGRTDFPGGDFSVLNNTVKKLYELDGYTVVLSGHGPSSTINHEKNNNPFIRWEKRYEFMFYQS